MLEFSELAGLAIVLTALTYAAIALVFGFIRRLRAAAADEAKLCFFRDKAALHLEAARVERDRRTHSWDGWRKFFVTDKVEQAEGIWSFELKPHDRRPLPSFAAGQHVTLRLRLASQANPVVRCYSLSDSPLDHSRYRITVKRVDRHHNGRPGLASQYLCDSVSVGDILDLQAPTGQFVLDPSSERPLVFLASGVGITPLLSMLASLTAHRSRREVWLFYGVRNRDFEAFGDELRQLDRDHQSFHLVVCHSQPPKDTVAGQDFDHEGRVDISLVKETLPSNNFGYFLCGPPAMMNDLRTGLTDWGVPESDVRFEAFGALSTISDQDKPGVEACEVVFDRSSTVCQWRPQDGSLLELAESNDVGIDAGCRAGSCGSCITAVKEGEVHYTIDPSNQPEPGSCLACIALPKGRLVLDA
jgi:ferredoxin-NADP reductase